MDDIITPKRLIKEYKSGTNISQLLKEQSNLNAEDMIEISYELQAGSYLNFFNDETLIKKKKKYVEEIFEIINSLGDLSETSILEAGVGESVTLSLLMDLCKCYDSLEFYGFDISWSRIYRGKSWLQNNGFKNFNLAVASLKNIPLKDNSIDYVYTSHSIEPNGGAELEIIKELYRITNRFLILFEPHYESSSQEVKKRMDQHGYCKNLISIFKNLNLNLLKYGVCDYSVDNKNPTSYFIIEKKSNNTKCNENWVCPKYKSILNSDNSFAYSEEGMTVYPIIKGIPCLRVENGILALDYQDRDQL